MEKLEKLGLVELPSKRLQKKRESKKVIWTEQSQMKPDINCSLVDLGSITLKVVSDKAEVTLWNEYVDRHHYLGYKHPIGAALKYFILSADPQPQILGCLLFSASAWHLADRDQWIGWNKKDREKRLNLVVNNNRFLIFPWVNVPNLASKALALVTRKIRDDWHTVHGYRPVLIETFVDDSQYLGTCYQAAN